MFRVLLVDDEAPVRVSIGYSISAVCPEAEVVGEASNGLEALELIRQLHPDIVLTDVKMPTMDGLEMIDILRRENPEVQVVILSGFAEFDYARRAIVYGVTDYLVKPVSEESLKQTLQTCMERISSGRETAHEPAVSKRIIQYIDAHYREDLFLDKLAEEFKLSPKYLSSLVKNETGKNFSQYLTDFRLERAKDLLLHTDLSVKKVSDSVGYPDFRYFHRLFKKHVGKTPSQYRKMT